MKSYRRFESEQELKEHIRDNFETYVHLLKEKIAPLEENYRRSYKQGVVGIFLVIASIVTWYIHPPILIPLSLLFLYFGIKMIRSALPVVYSFNKALNQASYSLVFKLFDLEAEYFEPSEEVTPKKLDYLPKRLSSIKYVFPKKFYHDTLTPTVSGKVGKLLDHSMLMTEPRNTIQVDDAFTSKFSNREMYIAELDVKHIERSRRRVFVKNIFSGLFVALELPRTLEGKTFISTELGLLFQDIGGQVFDPDAVETELEWNDFEKLLEVKTTNPIEARYILTPDFMEDLFIWWRDRKQLGDKKLQVRLSFVGNHMYVLFPDKRTRVGNAALQVQAHETQKHLESIALPLMHILNLIDDVEHRIKS